MIVRSLWLVVLPTLVLLVIPEASSRNPLSVNEHESNVLKLSDVKGKKIKHKARAPASGNLSADLEGEILMKVNGENGRNEVDGGRFKRDATESGEFKDAKKSYAKLKLAQTRSDLKKWKNKDCGKCLDERTTRKIEKRQANYRNNRISASRSKRYAETRYQRDDKTDYYAQRKAIMDRFYARQKEIEEKYAKKSSITLKYIYTRDSDTENDTSNVSSPNKVEENAHETNNVLDDLGTSTFVTTPVPVTETTTEIDQNGYLRQVQPVENSSESPDNEDVSDYDYYFLNDDGNDVSNDSDTDNRIDTLKWGKCLGKLLYQNNLILNVHNSSSVEANLTVSLNGPFCVTCVRVTPMNATRVNMSFDVSRNEDGEFNLVKVSMKGFYQELWYITKIWATRKTNDVCKLQN